uniref:Terminase small subunit n=1 Tax=Candidatus Kentrum sp. FM TaxID=2126340 RepID=A0A450WB63_9GAMM|nr:MAG: Terminase small subunit [Candidatus Kentron sp. FM]VFJ67017.1 MAG: Terminase small subunit [Candidatus Kentron sp. FM]VFK14267.1 MAG: Terminase small subunit [Candidatus Kentron sp. FM]
MALTKRQERFVHHYHTPGHAQGNATRAAKEAGYSEKTATQAGSRLLKNVNVSNSLEALRKGAPSLGTVGADGVSLKKQGLSSDNLHVGQGGDACGVEGTANPQKAPNLQVGELLVNVSRNSDAVNNVDINNALKATGLADDCLNKRQRDFVFYYDRYGDATLAAKKAGYSPKTANEHGSRLLKNPHIKKLIEHFSSKRAARLRIDKDRIVQELATIAFANESLRETLSKLGIIPPDVLDGLSTEALAQIAEYSTVSTTEEGSTKMTVKLHSRLAALDKLSKTLGLYQNKVEITAPEGIGARILDARRRFGIPTGLPEPSSED